MRYPELLKNTIDITAAPYFADNSGRTDSTAAIRRAIDDCLKDYVTEVESTRREIIAEAERRGGENTYFGVESARVVKGEVLVTFPTRIPEERVIYFPKGTYLVSDTVSYTIENLSTRQQVNYTCELCRCIHLVGESADDTVIRLADGSAGFSSGEGKPVISFNVKSTDGKETTNCAQNNSLEDITVDCGEGNPRAIGVLFAASNCGRIENLRVLGDGGECGVRFDYGSECCVENLTVKGFEYGMELNTTSPIVMNGIDLSGCLLAGVCARNGNVVARELRSGNIPGFDLRKSSIGRYYFGDDGITYTGKTEGNFVFYEKKDAVMMPHFEKSSQSVDYADHACVDDFGAVGDGKTDSTVAIQRAMNSGAAVIVFGRGTYLIGRTVRIPATVKLVDLAYCDLLPGRSLLVGEMDAVFDVCEDSDSTLFIERVSPSEDFSGFFRLIRHSTKRRLSLKDIYIACGLYYNTQEGGEVFVDNCFTHTNHYTQNAVIGRDGYTPVFCRIIPVELHGQKFYARNLNIERADLSLLNDSSTVIIDGYKIEGPSILAKTVGGGYTDIHLYNAAWWGNKIRERGLFELESGELTAVGGHIFCYPRSEEYCRALTVVKDGERKVSSILELGEELFGEDALRRSLGSLIRSIDEN